MDGYTYMIERNKLLIRHGRQGWVDRPGEPRPAAGEARFRERLMELYAQLEGCGRQPRGPEDSAGGSQ
jgi:hypothetical protein